MQSPVSRVSHIAMAVAVGLAASCSGASAQTFEGVTVAQQGNGNTSHVEQLRPEPTSPGPTAVITQIGNNNHVGGPGGTTEGLRQINNPGGVFAQIEQTGTGNNAGLTQTGIGGIPTRGFITQVGNANTATLRQENSDDMAAFVNQHGSGNVSDVLQIESGTVEYLSLQNGTGNRLTVVQRGTTRRSPYIEQNGDGNVAEALINGNPFGGPSIRQTGSRNNASTVQTESNESDIGILQTGADNGASASQRGDFDITVIEQDGIGNNGNAIQYGMNNFARIGQFGNFNTAFVQQEGLGYVANVSQIGSGNYTYVYQH